MKKKMLAHFVLPKLKGAITILGLLCSVSGPPVQPLLLSSNHSNHLMTYTHGNAEIQLMCHHLCPHTFSHAFS